MIEIVDYSNISPKASKARIFLVDALTGELLNNWRPPFKKNSASPLAAEVASRLLGGFVDGGTGFMYTPAKIEWGNGIGLVGAPMDENLPDLESPFTPTRIMTDLGAPEYPGRGVIRFTSFIDTTSVPVGTQIQEVGLRTNPLSGYPDGILVARYQEASPVTLSSNRVRVGVEWIYIYA